MGSFLPFLKIWDLSDDGNMFKTLSDTTKMAIRDLTWSPNSQFLCSVGVKQKVGFLVLCSSLNQLTTTKEGKEFDLHYHSDSFHTIFQNIDKDPKRNLAIMIELDD